jgi:hypothetical protein
MVNAPTRYRDGAVRGRYTGNGEDLRASLDNSLAQLLLPPHHNIPPAVLTNNLPPEIITIMNASPPASGYDISIPYFGHLGYWTHDRFSTILMEFIHHSFFDPNTPAATRAANCAAVNSIAIIINRTPKAAIRPATRAMKAAWT